ncbi:MAG: aspartate ammonia-lyase, partial [Gemmatimonadetes bacterium]|nr:aspartate ammonia-lyase [Gemmatimonadota bacterium]
MEDSPSPQTAAEERVEKDSMGEVRIPAGMLYGAQTERARRNFPISGVRFGRRFIQALGAIKKTAAEVNSELGLLDEERSKAIGSAATEVMDGVLDEHFVLDIFQTGSGTSTNMNANEVIANRAIQLLGGEVGSKEPVHPNDHVNLGQSSNDVIPTATHVAAVVAIGEELLPGLRRLAEALKAKAEEFDDVAKAGRTHLQDATPVRLGQEFAGYASQLEHGIRRAEAASRSLGELAIGGTAVGTGI